MRILDRSVYGLWYSGDRSGLLISCYWIHSKSSRPSILIFLYFFSLIDYVFGCLQIDLSTIWNVFIITEIHKRQFHSFICILHHYTWLYHDIQIIRKMGIILLLWSIHMIKSMNFNFFQAAANIFSYFKTKVQLHLEVEYQKNIRYTFVFKLLQIKSCFHYNCYMYAKMICYY